MLWGGGFWTDGYYVATVGEHGNEEAIAKYVRNHGKEGEYKKLYKKPQEVRQYNIFDYM